MIDLGFLGFFRRIAGVDQGLLWHIQLFFAVGANAAYEALRADQIDRSGYQERLNTHVHQTADGGRRIVGVQGGKHQVPGERGFDCNFRRLKVADFADENDVGILAQEGTQRGCEVQADLLFHLHLVDSAQLEFDGIFRGHDVGVDRVEARH